MANVRGSRAPFVRVIWFTEAGEDASGANKLRFFFRVTPRRHDIADHIPFVSQPQKLLVMLSPDEVARLLAAARGPKYKAALGTAYEAGLRASEIRMLRVTDIDSQPRAHRADLQVVHDGSL